MMSKTALIVDDSAAARVVLSRILSEHALDVDTAESAEQALDYLLSQRPDVIFMDHLMPGMDGFQAVQAIKANPDTASVPVIALTAHAMQGDEDKALEAGCDDYDTKPVNFKRLLEKIQKYLD